MKIFSHFLYSGFKSSGLIIKCFFFSIGNGIQNSAWNSFSKSREILLKEHWLVIGHTLTDGSQFTLEPGKKTRFDIWFHNQRSYLLFQVCWASQYGG